jgi:Ca2+-transporting ATPase
MLITTILVSFFTQLAFIYVPLMQNIFQTESLSALDLGTVAVLAGISWCLHELRREWERRTEKKELVIFGGGTSSRGVEGLA